MTPAHWLQTTARLFPDAPALFMGCEQRASYAGFARAAAGVGAALRFEGIAPGDRVAVFMENHTDYLIALYGIWTAGAIAVPINAKLHGTEAAWILEEAGARACFVSKKTAGALEGRFALLIDPQRLAAMTEHSPAEPPEAAPDETLWLFYTSGTTGRPKGVCITHGNVQAMCMGYYAGIGRPGPGDAILYAAPMSHGAGLYNFMNVIGAARHVVAPSGGFDAEEVLDLSARLGNVAMFAAPTMVRRLVDVARYTGKTGAGLETVIYAGGPMYLADILDAVEVMGDRFVQIYGQGECPMSITVLPRALVSDRTHPRWRARLASVGVAQPICQIRLAGEGAAGEVLVKGPNVMAGYWNAPEATAEALAGGWLHTGDIGRIDEDGFLTLIDRSKDVIISGGSNVYPREVEEVLLTHPEVRQVAVVGRRDEEWGEVIVAHVVGTASPEALDALCLSQIARFKRPKDYIFHEELPKNNYGKVVKTALRDS